MIPDESSDEEQLLRRILPVVEGYMSLGMPDMAWAELARLGPAVDHVPEFLEARLLLLMQEKKWESAVEVGQKLCRECPERGHPFIHTGFCLHELGRTEEALRALKEGPESLQDDPIFHYNMGCYYAVLGRRDEARQVLRVAFALDESLKNHAKKDRDLEGVWSGSEGGI